MADNYLEKKMDDYRRGAVQSHRPRRSSPDKTAKSIYVINGCSPESEKEIVSLRKAGHRVAFSSIDLKAGRKLAQETGSQHHYIDARDSIKLQQSLDYVAEKWGKIDEIKDPSGYLHPNT